MKREGRNFVEQARVSDERMAEVVLGGSQLEELHEADDVPIAPVSGRLTEVTGAERAEVLMKLVAVSFFKQSGKWFADDIINWPVTENAADGDWRGAFKRVLKAPQYSEYVGCYAVVTADNPLNFPLMLMPRER